MIPILFSANIMLLILIVSAIIVLGIFAARLLNKPEWEAWAKNELSELVISVFILLFIFTIYSTLNMLANKMLIINPRGELLDSLINILEYLYTISISAYYSLLFNIELLKIFAGGSSSIGPGSLSISYKPFSFFELPISGLETITFLFNNTLLGLYAQIIFFKFVYFFAYDYLLPIGIFFRFLPIFRRAGNEIIAMVIVGAIILPFFYLFFIGIMSNIEQIHNYSEGPISSAIRNVNPSILSTPIFNLQAIFSGTLVTNLISVLFTTALTSSLFMLMYSRLLSFVYFLGALIFFIFMLPTFAVIISLAFMKSVVSLLEFKPELTGVMV